MQPHPVNSAIRNGPRTRLLIFLNRHPIPLVTRGYMLLLGCDIAAKLPAEVFFPHPQGIVIHRKAIIGRFVVIGHQVTIGGKDLSGEYPVIEDGVYVGAGAKILGGLRIGRGATVGANAVVTRDVPPGRVVVGSNRILDTPSLYKDTVAP